MAATTTTSSPMLRGPAPRSRIEALSSLRVFAAMQVVVYHFSEEALVGAPRWLVTFVEGAQPAVTLLFVLSGFILTYGYGDALASGRVSPRRFWLARFARVYPLYVVAFAIEAVAILANPAADKHNFALASLAHLFAIQSWFPPLVNVINIPAWSICCEVAFYACFPFLVGRIFVDRRRSRLVLGGVAAWLIGLVIPILYVLFHPDGRPRPFDPAPWFDFVRFSPLARFPEFIVGMAVARLFLRDLAEGRARRGASWAVGGVASYLALIELRDVVFPFDNMALYHDGLLAPVCAVIVFGLAHGGWPSRILAARPLVRLGEASYALYILQSPVFTFVSVFLIDGWEVTPFFLLQIIALLLSLSVVSFQLLETPARRALTRVFERWSSSPDPGLHSSATPRR